jgi:hypothetical protein
VSAALGRRSGVALHGAVMPDKRQAEKKQQTIPQMGFHQAKRNAEDAPSVRQAKKPCLDREDGNGFVEQLDPSDISAKTVSVIDPVVLSQASDISEVEDGAISEPWGSVSFRVDRDVERRHKIKHLHDRIHGTVSSQQNARFLTSSETHF